MRGLARAISYAASSPALVSMMTCSRVPCPRSPRRSSNHTTSSGVITFGSISAGGGRSAARMPWRSASPIALLGLLMRTTRSMPSSAWGAAKMASALRRASSLSFGATPSSSSTHTMSAPEASAFGKRSGRSAGEKMKLRRGRAAGTGLLIMDYSLRARSDRSSTLADRARRRWRTPPIPTDAGNARCEWALDFPHSGRVSSRRSELESAPMRSDTASSHSR